MAVNTQVNVPFSSYTGSGKFVGSISPIITTPTIIGFNGNNVATFSDVPSATDYFNFSSGITNGAAIQLISSNANGSYVVLAKGTGGVLVGSNSNTSTIPFGLYNGTFKFHYSIPTWTADRTITLRDLSGTLAYLSDIPGGSPSALTEINDTNVTLTLGGTPSTALLQPVSMTLGWSGLLAGGRGGTGVNNGSNTATYAGNLNFAGSFTTSGAFSVTQTYTGATSVTFPTTGTLATISQLPTGAALTSANDTNVTLTLGGTPSTALLQATSITAGWTGQLGLMRGGSGASLTASNGGIVYSTASALAILPGTATANQMLQSGLSTTPSWSTATWPSTTMINQILYSSANNTVTGLATANNSILVTSSGGVPSLSTTLPAFTTSSITFNPTTGGIVGTTTNDNAATGKVGEFVTSTVLVANALPLTATVGLTITSISLTAGDWDVFGLCGFTPNASTTIQYMIGSVSTTNNTVGAANTYVQHGFTTGATLSVDEILTLPTNRFSLSTTTTIYLIAQSNFAVSTMAAYGTISARRVR